jgi:hypothetical protein
MAIRDIVQAAAGVGGAGPNVEEVFSTYLYTGTGSARSINNGIDLSGEGGLVWIKSRSSTTSNENFHFLSDSERGKSDEYGPDIFKLLYSNATSAQDNLSGSYRGGVGSFNSNGFTLSPGLIASYSNNSSETYASWTFRKAPKFFDVVTYTGDGVAGLTIPHSLGSVPGCIIIKSTNSTLNWYVYHRYDPTKYLQLNLTAAAANFAVVTATSDTTFTLPADSSTNADGYTYVAYLFAHDAGGFGDDGEQNVISCGSFTTSSIGEADVNLGYPAQFVIVKRTDAALDWYVKDTMRGMVERTNSAPTLMPNTSAAETGSYIGETATGFNCQYFANSASYIYIAIRRPMKTPEAGTEVFNAVARSGTSAVATITGVGFAPDLIMPAGRSTGGGYQSAVFDRLRGASNILRTNSTAVENNVGYVNNSVTSFDMDGMTVGSDGTYGAVNSAAGGANPYINWFFKRATSVFDIVCDTGTNSAHTIAHNLGVVPELIIRKKRNNVVYTFAWSVYHANNTANPETDYLVLESTAGTADSNTIWNDTAPTASVFSVGNGDEVNHNGKTFVTYLFASLAGVSKCGSYTGTGADLNVDCGFSAGARFILIKRTDSTGDWYVWDSIRGISAGNDPYLNLNNTLAENTSTDYIDPLSSGFTVTSSAPAALNESGGSYLFLAIA